MNVDTVTIASGPSLTQEDVDAVVRWRDAAPARAIIAINESCKICPTANICYAGDYAWFAARFESAKSVFHGEFWTGDDYAPLQWPNVHGVRRIRGTRLPAAGTGIAAGGIWGHSGFQAWALAVNVLGARGIALLGYD